MSFEKGKNARDGGDEGVSQLRVWRVTDHHQQRHAMCHDGGKFVRLVADSSVVGDGGPSAFADRLQPGFIGAVVGEMIGGGVAWLWQRVTHFGETKSPTPRVYVESRVQF